jgi:lipopolysaccharide/colanic/teichoic acid biosynthesis glycosyltransferase
VRTTDIAKRAFDVFVAGTLCVAAIPVIAVSAFGAAISLRAWPFFTQRRVGRDGRAFRFVKLRTLPRETPRYASKYEIDQSSIPPFCKLLRLLHVDELPQLFLVVSGRMSLVGPRPEMPHLHGELDPIFAERRTSVRPGCSGLWQVSSHCHEMIFEHPEFDDHYLENRTMRLDLWILSRTARLMIPTSNRRLVSLREVPAFSGYVEERQPESNLQSVEA